MYNAIMQTENSPPRNVRERGFIDIGPDALIALREIAETEGRTMKGQVQWWIRQYKLQAKTQQTDRDK